MITTMANSSTKYSDRRACDRIEHRRDVVLRLGEEFSIEGYTNDLSLGGVCVLIEDEIESNYVGQSAYLSIKGENGQLSPEFSGTVVRINSDSICLKFDRENAARFGMMITRGIFRKKASIQ